MGSVIITSPEAALPEPSSSDPAAVEQRLRRRERELRAIRRVNDALYTRTNLDDIEREALVIAVDLLNASGGTIYLHDPQKKVLIFKYVLGATPEITRKLQGMEMPDDRGIAGGVFQSGEGQITLKVGETSQHNREVDAKTQFRTESTVTVPLKTTAGVRIGVMQLLNRKDGAFDDDDLEVLGLLGAYAAQAIENARLHEEARRASVVNLIGDISHDVKNFLTPVVTGTQTLEMIIDQMYADLDDVIPQVPAELKDSLCWAVDGVRGFFKEAVNMVYDGSRDAQERVREIADAIKGITSKPHFELSDFSERAEQVAKYLKPVAEREGVLIDLTGIDRDLPHFEIDRKSIYNCLYNLINNAIPETPAGGRIYVRAKVCDFDGRPGIEIQVQDTGRGMPEHVRQRILSGDSISTKPGGTGLGTRIVLNVVELHGGKVDIRSEAGVGTAFILQLPQRQSHAEEAAEGAGEA